MATRVARMRPGRVFTVSSFNAISDVQM
jgi:hypothetical protein